MAFRSRILPEAAVKALASVTLGLTLWSVAGAHAQAVDPAAMAAHPDIELQGEYVGQVVADGGQRTWAAQIAARPDGAFEMLLYEGGLPGAGWDRAAPRQARGERSGGQAVFAWDGHTAQASGGRLELSHAGGGHLGSLERVERTSSTFGKEPPPGAVVLFDGTAPSLERWHEGARIAEDGTLAEGVTSVEEFGDVTLHVEFRLVFMPDQQGQARSNSGVYLQNRYEIQILDSFAEPPTTNGIGSIYQFRAPDTNMSFPPAAWQTYDIEFTAPRFDAGGNKIANARVSVWHNGVRIHDDVEVPGGTGAGGQRPEVALGPLYLQDHGAPVRFRNVWLVRN
jgi:hypothetical protein